MLVTIVGQGYVGLPIAMRAVEAGYDVTGVDADRRKVEQLHNGQSYIEDVPAKQVAVAITSGRYQTATVLTAPFDYAIITVPTPLKEGVPDLSYVERATESIAHWLTRGSTVIL